MMRGCPRLLWLAAGLLLGRAPGAAAAQASAASDSAFIDQYAATYHFTLGRPTGIHVTPAGDAVLFLRSGPRSFVQDLFVFDTATRRERVLLRAADLLRGAEEKLSAEERARRERLRQVARGFASFQLSKDGQRMLIPLAGRLFVVERGAVRWARAGAVTELESDAGDAIDPQLSPDGTQAACVRQGDLFVTDIASGRERRLTAGACDTLTHGLAEFVAQEEMDRFSGYWWSPDSRSIACETADLSKVEALHIADPVHPEAEPQSWRYPRAGAANAEVRLEILSLSGAPARPVEWDRWRYPYLAAVCWEKNAPLTLLVQNRRQTEEALLAVDERTGRAAPLLIEKDAAWLNLDSGMPKWLADGGAFLWTSERGGAWQLELRARDGRLLRTLTSPGFGLRRVVHLDDDARTVCVQASPDPTQLALWRVPLDRGEPERVTGEPGLHGAVFGEGHEVFVHLLEGPEREPAQTVERRDGSTIGTLHSVAETPLIAAQPLFVEIGARGPAGSRRYHADIVAPHDFNSKRSWPVLVHVYGGPLSQMVQQSRHRYLLDQWIANHGFVVVSFDGRGTPGRGRAWERAIRGNLIDIPLDDQVEALQALGHTMPGLDLTRVGIFGWSFGGYFSAMAAMRRPDVFRAGVAGAPVTDWRDYDTHYTERYLDLPALNPRGYRAGSTLTWAPGLVRPLLVIHGTADDNVYFMHSLKLCDALFRAGRAFEFLPLPGFTHMVPDPVVTARLYSRIMQFFERHLSDGGSTP